MNKRILLPTDFSENSRRAIDFAIELYKDDPCDFYLLNVFSMPSNIMVNLMNMEPGSGLYQVAKDKSEAGLNDFLDALMFNDKSKPNHHFKTISSFNDPIEAIKEIVDEKDIEMIVMGTKGETASTHKVFGSTAIYVMEKVRNCPVIAVPALAQINMPKEIVFPTGYKMNYKRSELNHLKDIAKKCDASIAILHVEEEESLDKDQTEHKELLEEILEGVKSTYHTLRHNSVETAVNIFVESRGSDMVAFINRKHAFFGSILSNPLVKGIAFHSRVPLLVMHDHYN
ncbi:MAG: universal stress protein [Bacteroidia bacterium]|nr:universal stress protein [Bacteroidia bacterium]NND11792.1 universal stress protein [Flavobacteriaceae bacterium]MBT8310716.1 universal stress protein [Bacteroidia bacterium]NNK26767.1 universal stress protein [Flavobacteriaceae bacterium]NNL61956.1 universal stress protein [Flavobacteriaceae bacterium]